MQDTRPGGSRTLSASGSIGRRSSIKIPGDTEVRVSQRLADFIAEFAFAREGTYVQLEDGTYDLHPDIRWCPSDVAPSSFDLPVIDLLPGE